MDNNEQVAALALQVLTLVMTEIEEQFFLQLMQKLLDMFRSDALSPAKGEHLIRTLAALLSAERVFTTFAVLLSDEAVCQQAMWSCEGLNILTQDRRFASTMIFRLMLIMFACIEVGALRKKLRSLQEDQVLLSL